MTNKQQTPQFIDEDDRKFYEGLRSMSEEDMLAIICGLRDALLAENGKLARELGLSDADVEKFSADVATLEQAVETERLAAQRVAETAKALTKAADEFLAAIDRAERSDRDGSDRTLK